jgi:hypothetical protein
MAHAKSHAEESPARVGLTRQEAAEKLGVSVRTFKRHEKENPFDEGQSWTEGKGPSARRMYDPAAIDSVLLEEGAEEQQSALAALMRETSRASVEIHKSAAIAIKAGVDAIQGTDPRTKILVRQLKRASRHNANLERTQVAMWQTMHALQETYAAQIVADAKSRAGDILSQKRTSFMIESLRDAWPGLLHKIVPSTQTGQSILSRVMQRVSPEWRAKLAGLVAELPPELAASVYALVQEATEQAAKEAEKRETEEESTSPK